MRWRYILMSSAKSYFFIAIICVVLLVEYRNKDGLKLNPREL